MFSETLERLAWDSSIFAQDLASISHNIKQGEEKPAPKKTLEPTVRLMQSKEEIKNSQETNPDLQFINEQLQDLFKG